MSKNAKGPARMADVSAARREALSCGQAESKTLVEALTIDMAQLLANVYPALHDQAHAALSANTSFTQRMAVAGELALAHDGPSAFDTLARHKADTVRGWAAYVLAAQPGLSLKQRLAKVRPLANDPHFGVREWAWLALRPHLMQDTQQSLSLLVPWVNTPEPNLRRYASEITRPRGVWCKHWPEFKAQPELGLDLLEPLKSDPNRYVQDSVANWLNDASKQQPEWVNKVCTRWQRESDTTETSAICKRAMRSLRAKNKLFKAGSDAR